MIGSSSAVTNVLTFAPVVQVEGTTANTSRIAAIRNAAATGAFPSFICAKSRGTSNGSYTIVQSGDKIGSVEFAGADGAKFVGACSILAEVDGTPGLNDMPGRMIFSTTADSASSPTERLRIDSSGRVGIGTSSPTQKLSVNGKLHITDDIVLAQTNGRFDFDNGNSSGALRFHSTSGNAERMRITSAGNVGIGTSSPTSYGNSQATLVIEDDTNPAICWSDTGQTRDWWAVANGSNLSFNYADGGGSGSASNVTTALSMDSSGKVGIGTASPQAPFVISNSGVQGIEAGYSSGTSTNFIQAYNRSTTAFIQFDVIGNPLVFKTGSSAAERVRIDSSGRLLVGTTTEGAGSYCRQFNDCGFWTLWNHY